MTATPYATAAEVLADRTRWCCAVLGRLIQQGRREGWVDGAPIEPPALEAIAAELGGRLAVTPLDPEVRLVEWMAARLELGAREIVALWLLTCIEIAPAAARLAQALGACDRGVLSLAIVRALVPLADGELAHLEALGLLEVTGGARVPQSRRGVRAADRVIALAQGELDLDRELRHCASVHAEDASGFCPEALRGVLSAQPAPVIVATGPDGAGRATALAACAATGGLGTLRVRAPVRIVDEHGECISIDPAKPLKGRLGWSELFPREHAGARRGLRFRSHRWVWLASRALQIRRRALDASRAAQQRDQWREPHVAILARTRTRGRQLSCASLAPVRLR